MYEYAKVREISFLLWKQNIYFCVYTNLSLAHVMSQSWIITVDLRGPILIRCLQNFLYTTWKQSKDLQRARFAFILTASCPSYICCKVFLYCLYSCLEVTGSYKLMWVVWCLLYKNYYLKNVEFPHWALK